MSSDDCYYENEPKRYKKDVFPCPGEYDHDSNKRKDRRQPRLWTCGIRHYRAGAPGTDLAEFHGCVPDRLIANAALPAAIPKNRRPHQAPERTITSPRPTEMIVLIIQ
jgi:hypothetical protein